MSTKKRERDSDDEIIDERMVTPVTYEGILETANAHIASIKNWMQYNDGSMRIEGDVKLYEAPDRSKDPPLLKEEGTFEVFDESVIIFTHRDGRKTELHATGVINEGAYGRTWRFTKKGIPYEEYAVKIMDRRTQPMDWDDWETEVQALLMLEELREKKIDCGEVSARLVGVSRSLRRQAVYVIMPNLDGTLEDFKLSGQFDNVFCKQLAINMQKTEKQARIHGAALIVEKIRKQVYCLMVHSGGILIFTDLKHQNVMYRLTNSDDPNDPLDIHLIDLGSMLPDEDREYTFTFPCVEGGAYGEFKNATTAMQCVCYAIGILFCFLVLGRDAIALLSHGIDPQTRKDAQIHSHNKLLKEVSAHPEYSHLANLMNPKPERRLPLSKPFIFDNNTCSTIRLQPSWHDQLPYWLRESQLDEMVPKLSMSNNRSRNESRANKLYNRRKGGWGH